MTKQTVIDKAIQVFRSARIANSWLNTPSDALDGKKPIDLASTPRGLEHLMMILLRLEQEEK